MSASGPAFEFGGPFSIDEILMAVLATVNLLVVGVLVFRTIRHRRRPRSLM